MQNNISEQFVRNYLLSRNYKDTLRTFENERSNKDKSHFKFQPTDIVERIQEAIFESNLNQLINDWNILETTLFAHLSDNKKQQAAKSLKVHTFRTYLVHAKIKKRSSKLMEFFELLKSYFHFDSKEWHFWCALPYISEPQLNADYFMYFTKSWTDILFLSLTNFLCLIFYSEAVTNHNKMLKEAQNSFEQSCKSKVDMGFSFPVSNNQPPSRELLDDFSELNAIRANPKNQ